MWLYHASHGRKKLDIQNVYRSHKDNLFNAYHCIGYVCPSIKEKIQRILENSFSFLWYIVAFLYFLPFPLSKGIIAFVPSSHSFNYSTPVKSIPNATLFDFAISGSLTSSTTRSASTPHLMKLVMQVDCCLGFPWHNLKKLKLVPIYVDSVTLYHRMLRR